MRGTTLDIPEIFVWLLALILGPAIMGYAAYVGLGIFVLGMVQVVLYVAFSIGFELKRARPRCRACRTSLKRGQKSCPKCGARISHGNPRVSVIVAAHNEGKVIKGCIETILKSDYENRELIVVNDGSIDATGAVLESLKKKYAELRVIHIQVRGGKAAAVNKALAVAKGEIIVTVDADTYIEPAAISRLVENFEFDPKVGAVCGYDRPANVVNWLVRVLVLSTHVSTGFVRRALSFIGCLPVVNFGALRKDVLMEVAKAANTEYQKLPGLRSRREMLEKQVTYASGQIASLDQEHDEALKEFEHLIQAESTALDAYIPKFCPSCKTMNFNDAKYCDQCNARLASRPTISCPKCGALNPAGTRYCKSDGTPLPRYCATCAKLNENDAISCPRCESVLPRVNAQTPQAFFAAVKERMNVDHAHEKERLTEKLEDSKSELARLQGEQSQASGELVKSNAEINAINSKPITQIYADSIGEDLELTLRVHELGYQVVFEPEAGAYSETPVKLSTLWNQRVRWARGFMQSIRTHKNMLLQGAFGWFLLYSLLSYTILPIVLVAALGYYAYFSVFLAPAFNLSLLWNTLMFLGVAVSLGVIVYSLLIDRSLRDGKYLWVFPAWPVYSFFLTLVCINAFMKEVAGRPRKWDPWKKSGAFTGGLSLRGRPKTVQQERKTKTRERKRHGRSTNRHEGKKSRRGRSERKQPKASNTRAQEKTALNNAPDPATPAKSFAGDNILRFLTGKHQMSPTEIAGGTSLNRNTVRRELQQLLKRGLISRQKHAYSINESKA